MAEEEVVLLDFWMSPYGIRVRIAFSEKGVTYEFKEELIYNKSQLLLKMNPVLKQIPVMIHNGKPIPESPIIVEYIDEVWKDKSPLFPSDPYQRAQARFWTAYVDKKIYSLGKLVWSTTGETQEAAKIELIGCFKLLEGELGNKTYFGGINIGIVDIALIPYYTWFHTLEKTANFSMVAECPQLIAWAHRCLEKESVSKSVPDQYKVHEFLMEIRNNILTNK